MPCCHSRHSASLTPLLLNRRCLSKYCLLSLQNLPLIHPLLSVSCVITADFHPVSTVHGSSLSPDPSTFYFVSCLDCSTKARETSNKYISAKVIPFILTIKVSLNVTVKPQTLIVACEAQHGLVPASHVFPKVFPSASTLFLPLWPSEMTYLSSLLWTKCLCPPQIHMRPYPPM